MTEHVQTTLAQIGNRSDEITGTVNPPVYFSSAYRHKGIGESTGFDYIRTKNPTRQLVEDAIAKLEGGTRGFAFSSGMAAIQTIMALFQSGDELIVSSDLYGGHTACSKTNGKNTDCAFCTMISQTRTVSSQKSRKTRRRFL